MWNSEIMAMKPSHSFQPRMDAKTREWDRLSGLGDETRMCLCRLFAFIGVHWTDANETSSSVSSVLSVVGTRVLRGPLSSIGQPRPWYGIFEAITVRNGTLASSGKLAM